LKSAGAPAVIKLGYGLTSAYRADPFTQRSEIKATPSFPRKQESSLSGFPATAWIPAYAGMTGKNKGGGERNG
jgi:hypothetical protein